MRDTPSDDRRTHRADALLACVTAAICVAPYATLTLPFRWALYGQAGLILFATASLVAVALLGGGAVARLLAAPVPVRLGLALYAGAAVLGSAVALARGNALEAAGGQALSLLLLPLAGAGALGLPTPTAPRAFGLALVGATTAVSGGHLVHWLVRALQGEAVLRLYFANKVSAVGPCLLALLLALAWRRSAGGWRRALATACLVVLTLYTIGSGVRGLWVVTPVAVVLFATLVAGPRSLLRFRAWLAVALVIGLSVGLVATFERWIEAPRLDLLADDAETVWSVTGARAPRGGDVARARDFDPDPSRAYLFRATFSGGSSGKAYATLRWRDAEGLRLDALPIVSRASPESRELATVGSPPEGSEISELAVGTRRGARGDWTVSDLRAVDLGPAWIAPVARQLLYFDGRVRTLIPAGVSKRPADRSVSLRLSESRAILARLRSASTGEALFGQGLGATFVHPGTGDVTNYIHDFYLFLLFKLGVVGTALVVGAIVCWLVHFRAALVRLPRGSAPRAFLAAALAGWSGYLVWSVSSPEILDFRVAPLWGLLIAAGHAAARCDAGLPGARA